MTSEEQIVNIENRHRTEAVISAIVIAFAKVPFSFFNSAPEKSAQIQWLQQVLDSKGARTVPAPFDRTNGSPVFLWCMDFTSLSVEQAHYVLPRLLIDTASRWPEDELVDMDAADIVLRLDIYGNFTALERETISTSGHKDWFKAYERVQPALAKFRAAPFQGLSRPQIEAIILWIEFVQTWPGVEYHLENLQSAWEYWTAFLAQTPPEPKAKKKRR